MNGSAASLRLSDHLHDLGEHCIATNLVGTHHETAGLVHGAADHLLAGSLGHRHGLTRHHGLVDGAAAFQDLSIHGYSFAGPHPQLLAGSHFFEAYVLIRAISFDPPRYLWREVEQSFDRATRLLSRPQLQHLAEQHEHGNHRGRFEIDRDGTVSPAHGRWKHVRRYGADDAVDPGHACAHGNEREHIEVACPERGPATLEEWPPCPQNDRRCESELNPVGLLLTEPLVETR